MERLPNENYKSKQTGLRPPNQTLDHSLVQVLSPEKKEQYLSYNTIPVNNTFSGTIKYLHGIPYGQNYLLKNDKMLIKNIRLHWITYDSDSYKELEVEGGADMWIGYYTRREAGELDTLKIYGDDNVLKVEGRFWGWVHSGEEVWIEDLADGDLVGRVDAGGIFRWSEDAGDWDLGPFDLEPCTTYFKMENDMLGYGLVDLELDLTIQVEILNHILENGLIIDCTNSSSVEVWGRREDLNPHIKFKALEYPYVCIENNGIPWNKSAALNTAPVNIAVAKLNTALVMACKGIYCVKYELIDPPPDPLPLAPGMTTLPLFYLLSFVSSQMTNIQSYLAFDTTTIYLNSAFKTGNEILLLSMIQRPNTGGALISPLIPPVLDNVEMTLTPNASMTLFRTLSFRNVKEENETSLISLGSSGYFNVKGLVLGEFNNLSRSIYVVASSSAGTILVKDAPVASPINNVCFKCQQIEKLPILYNMSSQEFLIPSEQSVELRIVDEFGRPYPRLIYTDSGIITETITTIHVEITYAQK